MMMTMMKRNHERPLVESSKLWDRRQQSCAIHNVKAESAGSSSRHVKKNVERNEQLSTTRHLFALYDLVDGLLDFVTHCYLYVIVPLMMMMRRRRRKRGMKTKTKMTTTIMILHHSFIIMVAA